MNLMVDLIPIITVVYLLMGVLMLIAKEHLGEESVLTVPFFYVMNKETLGVSRISFIFFWVYFLWETYKIYRKSIFFEIRTVEDYRKAFTFLRSKGVEGFNFEYVTLENDESIINFTNTIEGQQFILEHLPEIRTHFEN